MDPNNINQNNPQQAPTPSQEQPRMSAHLPDQKPKSKKKEGLGSIVSLVSIIAAAIVIAMTLTLFVFQSYEVDGPSMETTLQNQDRLLVLKVPKTIANIMGKDYIPNRNDIIIFNTTSINEIGYPGEEKQLIKRVIGLPGDRIVIENGIVTVYNNEFPEGFNPDKLGDHGENVDYTTSGNTEFIVEQGEVFVLGDNRANSLDSRNIGMVPSKDIVGKLIVRTYPIKNAKLF